MALEDFPTPFDDSSPSPTLSPAQESASAILAATLREWGLEELVPEAMRLIKEGLDGPAITLQLQETQAYKQRFAGNELRKQKGLPVLSPAEYVATEAAYKSVMRIYGLPIGFYDQPDDFNKFIGNDVSPDELNQRARAAQQVFLSADPGARQIWQRFYGLSGGAAIASILDPTRALPVVERMAQAAQFGAIAERDGLEANRQRLERYSDLGITEGDITTAFQSIAATRQVDRNLSDRFGIRLDQETREKEELLRDGNAARARQRAYLSEQALFANRAGANEDTLNNQRRGSF